MAHPAYPGAASSHGVEGNDAWRVSGDTLFEFGERRLRSLCSSIGFRRENEIVELFRRLTTPWGRRSVREPPSWPSTVGDDETPFEFSIGLGAEPEVRVMVEPLGDEASPQANADASSALLSSLAADFDVDLERFERVRDLFLGNSPTAHFVTWVAAGISETEGPRFKLYLNPFVQGEHLAPAVIEEALSRLGFADAWPCVASSLVRRGPDLDQLMYFSLDLRRSNTARVKVYARHRRCTLADLEAAASRSQVYRSGDVDRFVRAVVPNGDHAFEKRAPLTCYAFDQRSGSTPVSATTHIPINAYAPHDAAIRERVTSFLEQVGLGPEVYSRALDGFANRALDAGIGLQSYVSFRRDRGQPRLTIYFPVEAYRPGCIAGTPITSAPREPSVVLEQIDRLLSVADHPYARRLRREPPSTDRVGLLWANYQVFAAAPFDRRAAGLSARFDERPIRELLAGPEREQTGNVDASLAAGGTVAGGMSGPVVAGDREVPGLRLGKRWAELCGAGDVHRCLGVLTAGAVIGRQLGELLDSELRRQGSTQRTRAHDEVSALIKAFDARSVRFAEVCRLLPAAGFEPTWRGAMGFYQAVWAFLGELYVLSYS